jgi:hypothetical protein
LISLGEFDGLKILSYRLLSAGVTRSRHRFAPDDIDWRQEAEQEIPSKAKIIKLNRLFIGTAAGWPNWISATRRRPYAGKISRTFGK